jgi:succinate dehydrogenase/fumarate reductase flavoprotein subunit
MGNSLLDICVFGRRAGVAAAAWSAGAQPGTPTLAHLDEWKRARQETGLSDGSASPVILPDYTRKNEWTQLRHPA